MEQDGRKFCLVALDLTILTEEWTGRIRDAASARFGFEPDAVMVHVTQTHSAPSLGYFMVDEDFTGIPEDMEWLLGSQVEYCEFALNRVLEAIELADASLAPVRIRMGSGVEGRLGV